MQTDAQSVAELASALIRIESINPGPAGDDVPGPRERDVSRYIRDWLTARGIEAERREFLPGRFNVIASVAGSGQRRLLVDAHSDTIPAERMDIEPFSGEIRDGRVWGRGACDDKGTLAAMMSAFASLVEDGVTPPATVELLASGDEEGGFRGIRDWVAQGGQADGAIVGEASELGLITASRGAARFKVRTTGKAVHTCSPEKGINAITHMARVLAGIEDDLKPKMLERTHALLGGPRITPSMINGGRRANIVPDECIIDIDRRVLPCETRESVLAEFDAMLERVAATDSTMTVERLEAYSFVPAAECSAGDPLVAAASSALASESLPTEILGVPYTTHASVTAEAGIPTITVGPGSIEQAHSPIEFVDIGQLEAATRIYRRIFESYGTH